MMWLWVPPGCIFTCLEGECYEVAFWQLPAHLPWKQSLLSSFIWALLPRWGRAEPITIPIPIGLDQGLLTSKKIRVFLMLLRRASQIQSSPRGSKNPNPRVNSPTKARSKNKPHRIEVKSRQQNQAHRQQKNTHRINQQ